MTIWNEIFNQSLNFKGNSDATRSKRIQNILNNSFILICCIYSYVSIRALILLIEKSSYETTISFCAFLPLMFIVNSFYLDYLRKNKVEHKKEIVAGRKSLSTYENEIGFYSCLI